MTIKIKISGADLNKMIPDTIGKLPSDQQQTEITCHIITTQARLHQICSALNQSALVLAGPGCLQAILNEKSYEPEHWDGANKAHLTYVEFKPIYNGKQYNGVLLVTTRAARITNMIRSMPPSLNSGSVIVYNDCKGTYQFGFSLSDDTKLMKPNDAIIYVGTGKEILAAIITNTCDSHTRVLNASLLLIPHLNHVVKLRFNSEVPDRTLAFETKLAQLSAMNDGDYASLLFHVCCTFLLPPAFGSNNRRQEQILRRIKAACSSQNNIEFSAESYRDLYLELDWKPNAYTSTIDQTLGYIIGLQADGSYIADPPLEGLMDLNDAANKKLITRPAAIVMAQLALVYKNYRSNTISMGFACLAYCEPMLAANGTSWVLEIERIRVAGEHLLQHPYGGLVQKIPEARQVKQFPRICFAGAMFRKHALETQAEKDEFDNYKLQTITMHIESGDLAKLKMLMQCMPPMTIKTLASLATVLSAENMNMLLLTKDKITKTQLMQEVIQTKVTCPWLEDELDIRYLSLIKECWERFKVVLERRIDSWKSDAEAQTALEDDPIRRRAMVQEQNKLKNEFKDLAADIESEFLAPPKSRLSSLDQRMKSKFAALKAQLLAVPLRYIPTV